MNASAFDSPDTIELKGKLRGITRISAKAKIFVVVFIVVVVGFLLFSIFSMDDAETASPTTNASSQVNATGEVEVATVRAARPDFDNIGDGQAALALEQEAQYNQQPNFGTATATDGNAKNASGILSPSYNLDSKREASFPPTLAEGGSPSKSEHSDGRPPVLLPMGSLGAVNSSSKVAVTTNGPPSPSVGPQVTSQYLSPAEMAVEAQKKEIADRKMKAVTSSLEIQGGGDIQALLNVPNSTAAISDQLRNVLSAANQGGGAGAGSLGTGGFAAQQDDPNKQGRKEQFLKGASVGTTTGRNYISSPVQVPQSAYEIKAGWAIPSALDCGVNSDLPGQTCARVVENVYDSATGTHLLIPQQSTLIGTYDSQIAYGQERILVIWHRLIFPNGNSVNLDGMPGADKAGNAGFDADVNNHYGKVFGGAAFMATFSAAVSLTQKQNTAVNGVQTNSQVITQSLGQQLGQTGTAYIQRGMNVQPTLKRKPGYKFNVMVTKDIMFPSAYSEKSK